MFIQPICRLALRPRTRAFSLLRNRLRPSTNQRGFSTLDHAARPGGDPLSVSGEISQMRKDIVALQGQVKELRRGVFRTRMDKFMEKVKRPFRGVDWSMVMLYVMGVIFILEEPMLYWMRERWIDYGRGKCKGEGGEQGKGDGER